jgi:alanine racemase
MRRKTEALIDLDAIRANYALACRLAQESSTIAVIKADAYGHGAVDVAHALRGTAPAFAVALIDEALELREAGINEPLLVMEGVSSLSALECAAEKKLAVVVHNEKQIDDLERARLPAPISVWPKVDTGMHRLGLAPDSLADAISRLRASDNCDDSIVVCTHLASADVPGSAFTQHQLELFDACVANMDVLQSISNSAAILASPASHRDWNRPGYMLYGITPFSDDIASAGELLPAMTLQSEVIAIREVAASESVGYGGRWTANSSATIATVAIGYADGYPRHAPDGTPTIVNGCIAPLAGAVSMDMITVDVTGIEGVRLGDTVTLWGEDLSVNTIASAAGTIGYELLTGVTSRVPRVNRASTSHQE